MRLDKYLKINSIIKRRQIAKQMADAGLIEVNGKVAKASYEIKNGDEIKILFGEKTAIYQVKE